MEQFKGLSRDTTRVKTPAGMWEFARNILLTKGFTSVSNEYGFIEQVDFPGEVIGIISTNEETVILSIDGNFSCIGYFNNEELIYIPVLRSIYLGFKINHPIEGVFFYNFKQELIIAFCDGVALDSNTPKLINLNNLGFEVDVNYELVNPDDANLLNLFINTIEGNIAISYGTSSTIPIDIVYITFCYVLADNVSTTPYYPVHHIAYPTFQWDENNRRPVIINFTELDSKYNQIKIGLIINTDNGLVGYESFTINYGNSELNYTISSLTNFTTTSLDNLVVPTIFYNRVKTMTIQNNQLVIGNIGVEEELKIQKYVNKLNLKLQFVIDEEEKFTHPTLCPDEVYAIYIQPQWLNGEFGRAYPLIGPEPNNSNERNILNQTALDNLGLNEITANEFKQFHIINSGSWVLPPPFISNGDPSQVQLKWGFWENEETYPNTDDFNSTIDYNGNSLGGIDLRNQPIKYFRVPGLDAIIEKIPCPLGFTHKNNLDNSINFQGYIPKFGIYLDNFNTVFPEEIKEKMQGFRLLIAKRKQGDRLVEDIPFIHHGETRTMDIDGTNREFIHANYDNPSTNGGESLRHIYIQHGFSKLWSSNLSFYKNNLSAKIVKANYTIRHGRQSSSSDNDVNNPDLNLNDNGVFDLILSPTVFSGFSKINNNQKYAIIKDLIYVPGNNISAKTQFLEEGIFLKAKNYLQTELGGYTDLPDERWNPLLVYSTNGSNSRIDDLKLFNNNTRLYESFFVDESDFCYNKTLSVTLLNLQKNVYSGFNPKEFISLGRVSITESNKILSDNGDVFTNNIIRIPTGILLGTSVLGRIIYNDLYIKGIWGINNNSSIFILRDRKLRYIYELDAAGSESDLVNTFQFNLDFYNNDAFKSLNDLIVAISNNSLIPFINYFPFRVARTPKIPNENLQTNILRTFRANDYYEMLNDRGEIIAVRGTNKQLFIQQKYSLFIATLKDKLNTDNSTTYLGEGDIFDRTPDEIKFNSNKGYVGCTSQFACIICPEGLVVLDQIKGKIFLIGNEYIEISKANMINWFELNWDTKSFYILDRFNKKQRVDNPYNSIGHLVGYDEDNNRLLFTKKYYEFKFPLQIGTNYTFDGEFYYKKEELDSYPTLNTYLLNNTIVSNLISYSFNFNSTLFSFTANFVNIITNSTNQVLIGINKTETLLNLFNFIKNRLIFNGLEEDVDFRLILNTELDLINLLFLNENLELVNTSYSSNLSTESDYYFYYSYTRLIYNDERYFNNLSKTLSFQLDDKVWVCEHDYYPNAYYFNQLGLFSIYNNPTFELDEEGAVIDINFNFSNYIHNQKSVNRGLFYNKNYQSYIDLIFNGRLDLSKLYQAVTWESVVYTIEQARLYNNTIDAIMIYSDYQCSGVINLEQFVNCRNIEGVWNFNEFRDIVINSNSPIVDSVGTLVENNINFNKSFFDKSKFIGTFVVIRLIMFNNNTNDVYINQVNVKSRISKR